MAAGGVQHGARPAGAAEAAAGVQTLGVFAQALHQALVDICGKREPWLGWQPLAMWRKGCEVERSRLCPFAASQTSLQSLDGASEVEG